MGSNEREREGALSLAEAIEILRKGPRSRVPALLVVLDVAEAVLESRQGRKLEPGEMNALLRRLQGEEGAVRADAALLRRLNGEEEG